ncbi:MAG: hypothetical protein HQ592_16240 [Planctomycetes bacterium]|nr:hypothetical protein [Planctomycetota bacterium]
MEEVYRELGGKKFELGDFLIYGNKEDPQTWNLPVREQGKPEHTLMERAWHALHEGYKGRKYSGALAELARKRLTRLFESEKMSAPRQAEVDKQFREMMTPDSIDGFSYAIRKSFEYLVTPQSDDGLYHEPPYCADEVFDGHVEHGNALVVSSRSGPFEQYYMVQYTVTDNMVSFQSEDQWKQIVPSWSYIDSGDTIPAEVAELEEATAGHAISIAEQDDEKIVPMHLEVCLIESGWGNKKDMYFYPVDMLKENAQVFVEAKMYEKDHTPDKTNRDFVSVVESITGFTDDGGILANVVIVQEDLAKKASALQEAGLLHLLECSIQAKGSARKGTINGVAGKIVESISEVQAVDWVTKAGAGGHAVKLKGS